MSTEEYNNIINDALWITDLTARKHFTNAMSKDELVLRLNIEGRFDDASKADRILTEFSPKLKSFDFGDFIEDDLNEQAS